MKIKELSVVRFGTVQPQTLILDRAHLSEENGNSLPRADFFTYLFYGKIPSDLLISGSVLHGKITVEKEDGASLSIERQTTIGEKSVSSETLSVSDPATKQPLFFEKPIGEELFSVDESLFEPLFTLGTQAALPEHLASFAPLLLDADLKDGVRANALRRIDEASSSLLRQNGKGGAIYELQKKLSELEEKINVSEQAAKRASELEAELNRTHEEKEAIQNELQTLLELKDAHGNLTAIRAYDRLHEIENDLDEERKHYESFLDAHRHNGFLPTEDYQKEVDALQKAVTDAVRTYKDVRAELDLLESEEEDKKTLSLLDTAKTKYGSFDVVRSTARVLFRRAAHTTVFAYLALFAAAFFAVCTLAVASQNKDLAFALFLLTLCCGASSLVLLFSHRRFDNALLILCREFDAKNRDGLLDRLRYLEEEQARLSLRKERLADARKRFEEAKTLCTGTLETLNATTEKWGRRIDPSHALANFEVMLDDIRYFLKTKSDFLERIAEKERRVAGARKMLTNQSEIAVRALVSPFKRENLRKLERENRIKEISQGIDFYNRRTELLKEHIESLLKAHEESASSIGTPLSLYSERDLLSARKNALMSIYRSYLAFKELLQAHTPLPKTYPSLEGAFGYLALGDLLLHERMPLVIEKEALSLQERDALSHFCRENGYELFSCARKSERLLTPSA